MSETTLFEYYDHSIMSEVNKASVSYTHSDAADEL